MPLTPRPGEMYTIRRKVFKLFGASFHIYDGEGNVVGFCSQKAFKLREDIRLFTDESREEELLTMKTQKVIDFGATYDVALPDGGIIGSLRRKGLKSILRDSWLIFNESGTEIAKLTEDSGGMAFLRRIHGIFSMLSPQQFYVKSNDDQHIATLRTHMNPFVYRISVAIHLDHEELDELMVLAAGCLIAAIEGRQS